MARRSLVALALLAGLAVAAFACEPPRGPRALDEAPRHSTGAVLAAPRVGASQAPGNATANAAPIAVPAPHALRFGATDAARTARARKALAPLDKRGRVGFVLADATGRVLVAQDAERQLIPASNQKVITTATALALLGADFRFTTRLSGRVDAQGRLGDLVVTGDGDPSISRRFEPDGDPTAPLRRLALALKTGARVRAIVGDLVLDPHVFDATTVHATWPADQRLRWYEAPVAGLSFEDNCVRLRVTPSPSSGGAASVTLSPPGHGIAVSARVTTGGRGNPQIHVSRDERGGLVVSGRIPKGSRPYETEVAVLDPVRYFGGVFARVLAGVGLTIGGRVRIAPGAGAARGLPVLVTYETPIARVVKVANTRSQNGYAEHLFKRVGAAVRPGEPSSFAVSADAVGAWLSSLGIPAAGRVVCDGSGMSRENRTTPAALATVLLNAQALAAPAARVFRDSLAVSGGSTGTLRRRFLGPLKGRVLGKTGTLAGVDALSGYVLSRAGGRVQYVFAAIHNGRASHGAAHRALDAAVRAAVGGR